MYLFNGHQLYFLFNLEFFIFLYFSFFQSSIVTQTPTTYLECKLHGARLGQPVHKCWNAFAYIVSGKAWFGEL